MGASGDGRAGRAQATAMVITAPANPTAPAAGQPAGAPSTPSAGAATITAGAPAPAFSPPTIVSATITGCTVSSGGGGTVTCAVSFTGGTAWAPAANYRNGVYTVNVEGGNGANSGLNAVIAGAPIEDTADGVSTYVLFPPSMVLTARC